MVQHFHGLEKRHNIANFLKNLDPELDPGKDSQIMPNYSESRLLSRS